jgi:hypothetical protein
MDKLRLTLAFVIRTSLGLMFIPLFSHAGAEVADEALRLEAALLQRDLLVLASRAETGADLVLHFGQDSPADTGGNRVGSPELRIVNLRLEVGDRELLSRAYTDKESDALRRGGVDRLTATGIGSGSHQLKIVVQARDDEGRTVTHKGRVELTRADTPARVQVFFTSQPNTSLRVTVME